MTLYRQQTTATKLWLGTGTQGTTTQEVEALRSDLGGVQLRVRRAGAAAVTVTLTPDQATALTDWLTLPDALPG